MTYGGGGMSSAKAQLESDLAQHKAEELLAFFADSQEDESAPLEHPSVDRRFPPKRRRPADA